MNKLDRTHLKQWGFLGIAITGMALFVSLLAFTLILWGRWDATAEPVAIVPINPRQPRARIETNTAAAIAEAVVPLADDSSSAAVVSTRVAAFQSADTWLYQLSSLDIAQIAASEYDIVVVDSALSAADISQLQTKPDGSRRVVLAYMSIGEAKDYQYYWQSGWDADPRDGVPDEGAPDWLTSSNPEWCGLPDWCNYKVRYWHAGWQQLIISDEQSALNRVINAGFDGVYLDNVDVYQYFETIDDRDSSRSEMIAFVQSIALYARQTRGEADFLIVPQNGEALLESQAYTSIISGIAREGFYESGGHKTIADAFIPAEIALRRLAELGKPVLTLDYLSDPAQSAEYRAWTIEQGYVPFVGARKLDQLAPLEN